MSGAASGYKGHWTWSLRYTGQVWRWEIFRDRYDEMYPDHDIPGYDLYDSGTGTTREIAERTLNKRLRQIGAL